MASTLVRMFSVVAAAGALTLSAGAASLVQPEGKPGNRAPGGPGGDESRRGPGEGRSVEGAMKTMNRSLRQLKGVVGDAGKKEEALRLIGDMQRGCLAAKSLPAPGDVLNNAKDEAAKAHLREEFHHELVKLMRALLDLEEDVVAGKTDSAKTRVADLVKLRDHAHSEMGVADEDKNEGSGGHEGGKSKDKKSDDDHKDDKHKDEKPGEGKR